MQPGRPTPAPDDNAETEPEPSHDVCMKKRFMSTPLPGTDRRLPYWVVWLVALVVSFILGWGLSNGWGSSHWGPVAAWFSGALTAGAVSVSLWQAFEAK